MPRISIPIPGVDPGSRAQLEYALTFASEDLLSYEINVENSTIEARKLPVIVRHERSKNWWSVTRSESSVYLAQSSLRTNVNCRRLTLGLGCWSENG